MSYREQENSVRTAQEYTENIKSKSILFCFSLLALFCLLRRGSVLLSVLFTFFSRDQTWISRREEEEEEELGGGRGGRVEGRKRKRRMRKKRRRRKRRKREKDAAERGTKNLVNEKP